MKENNEEERYVLLLKESLNLTELSSKAHYSADTIYKLSLFSNDYFVKFKSIQYMSIL